MNSGSCSQTSSPWKWPIMTEQLEQKSLNLFFYIKIFIIFRWYIDKSSTFSTQSSSKMIATKAK